MVQTIEGMKPDSERLYDERQNWSNIYQNVGVELDEEVTIITGIDITMGLHSQIPCYRYEDPEYSMLQAINKFTPTHVFTSRINNIGMISILMLRSYMVHQLNRINYFPLMYTLGDYGKLMRLDWRILIGGGIVLLR